MLIYYYLLLNSTVTNDTYTTPYPMGPDAFPVWLTAFPGPQ